MSEWKDWPVADDCEGVCDDPTCWCRLNRSPLPDPLPDDMAKELES